MSLLSAVAPPAKQQQPTNQHHRHQQQVKQLHRLAQRLDIRVLLIAHLTQLTAHSHLLLAMLLQQLLLFRCTAKPLFRYQLQVGNSLLQPRQSPLQLLLLVTKALFGTAPDTLDQGKGAAKFTARTYVDQLATAGQVFQQIQHQVAIISPGTRNLRPPISWYCIHRLSLSMSVSATTVT